MNELFLHPAWLAACFLGAALSLGLWLLSERRRERLLSALGPRLAWTARSLRAPRRLAHILESASLLLLLLSLAGPQWGVELVSDPQRRVQALIAVDVSLSMLAEDMKPNRMEKAKSALAALLDGLRGQKAGVLAFSGSAHVQCPLTTDLDAAKSLLRRLDAGMLPQAGTRLAEPIALGARLLGPLGGEKALVLLTDGENTSGEEPLAAAREAAARGVKLFILGVGTPEGEPIPLKDAAGRVEGYKKDARGQTVVSRLGEAGLLELAASTRGAYYRLSQSEGEVQELLRRLLSLERSESAQASGRRHRNRYRLPLAVACLLLGLALLIPETGLGPLGAAPAACLLLALSIPGCKPSTEAALWRGDRRYAQGRYAAALSEYARAGPENARARFNAGAALYKMEEMEKARSLFQALSRETPSPRRRDTLLNLGNALFSLGRAGEAAEAYRRCLLEDPKDEDCRHNLLLALSAQKKQGGKGGESKPQEGGKPPSEDPSKNRSSSGMSREDARRVLEAVREREKESQKAGRRAREASPEGGADW